MKAGVLCMLEIAFMNASLAQKIPASEAAADPLHSQKFSSCLVKIDKLRFKAVFLLNSLSDCMSYPINIVGCKGRKVGIF